MHDDPETAIGIADHFWSIVTGLGGAIIGGLAMAWGKGQAAGVNSQRIDTLEARVTEARADIAKLSDRHDDTREELSDLRYQMVKQQDLKDMSEAVQAALAKLTTRIDEVILYRTKS